MSKVTPYDIVAQQITDIMAQGEIPWSKPYFTAKLGNQCNGMTKRQYTGLNAIILASRGFGNNHWLTFKQASDMGLKIRKGEKATNILGWFSKQVREEDASPEDYETRIFARYFKVFNADQLDQVPDSMKIGALIDNPLDLPRIAEADSLAKRTGAIIEVFPSCTPSYWPLADKIKMPCYTTFSSREEYYSTLFHELGHWTGHKTRLDRFKKSERVAFGNEEYSHEELVAELTAAFVCTSLSISSDTSLRNSAAYIQGWMKYIKDNSKSFAIACQQAKKASDFIMAYKK
jgi:antirestriction protein ArdC